MSSTSIYLGSAGVIGLIVLTAYSNRRSGWRKARTGAITDLCQLGDVWRASQAGAAPLSTQVTVFETLPSPGEADLFTAQLVNLRAALDQQGRVVAQTAPLVESVAVKRSANNF